MKVGLVGAPGAGKSELADALRRTDDVWDVGYGKHVVIIDNYVSDIEQETDMALGFHASYIGNLAIALGRYARERCAEANAYNYHRITCGTLLETATYAAIDGMKQIQIADDDGREDQIKRVQAAMGILACLYMDVFRYDHLFYLPVMSDDPGVAGLDRDLQAAFQAFFLQPVVPLLETDVDARVSQIVDAVKEKDGEPTGSAPRVSE